MPICAHFFRRTILIRTEWVFGMR